MSEENILVRQYALTISRLFPDYLSALENSSENDFGHLIVNETAIVLFRRYYVYNTIADYPPKEIMMGCMLLASKIEENRKVTVTSLSAWKPQFNVEKIVETEMIVMNAISFDLHIFSSILPLFGLISTLLSKCELLNTSDSKDALSKLRNGDLRNEAVKNIHTLLLSDALFLFSPPELALAAFSHVEVFKNLSKTFLNIEPNQLINPYFVVPTISKQEYSRLNEKLERVRNPKFVPGTPEYLKIKENQEQGNNERMKLKNNKMQTEFNQVHQNNQKFKLVPIQKQ